MLYIALALGTLFTVYWTAQLIFVKRHFEWSDKLTSPLDNHNYPGVSIIHPIKDLDFEFDKNLTSWLEQNYTGKVQHIFSFQDSNDPAIDVVKNVMANYPNIDMDITINPVMDGLNGKSSNMVYGVKLAKYDLLLFGDSDVRVQKDYILKMTELIKDEKAGIVACGQVNIGGRDFWTRFFTFLQNCETDFNWAFLARLGVDIGATCAAFAIRKDVLEKVGGFESFGSSLLEDMHLGNTLYRLGYRVVVGPFVECHVNKLAREKSFNYAKRVTVGIKAHISFEMPAFILMLFWYWAFFIYAVIVRDTSLILLSTAFMLIRTVLGLLQRPLTKNRIIPVDLVMPLFFDLFATFYLFYSFKHPYITWRGIRYKLKKGGCIEQMFVE